jgi:hypothetical protein
MPAPISMTSQTLNALKGWGANLHAVDYVAQFDPANFGTGTGQVSRVPAGAVVHVDATSQQYQLGVGNLKVMPMFTFQASDDPDVSNQYPQNTQVSFTNGASATVSPVTGANVAAAGGWVPIAPSGNAMALVAVGAFELVSTNFYLASGDNFAINNHLTSPVVGSANAGCLTKGTAWINTIVGVVSRTTNSNGTVDNGYGTQAVAFWPVYLPSNPNYVS